MPDLATLNLISRFPDFLAIALSFLGFHYLSLTPYWRFSFLFLHHILPSTVFPNGRLLFTCYFLGIGRNISFSHSLEFSQFMYFMTSLHHFTHSSLGRWVIYLKFVQIITTHYPQKVPIINRFPEKFIFSKNLSLLGTFADLSPYFTETLNFDIPFIYSKI